MCRASPWPGGLNLGSFQNVQARRLVFTLAEHVGPLGSLVFNDAACTLRPPCQLEASTLDTWRRGHGLNESRTCILQGWTAR